MARQLEDWIAETRESIVARLDGAREAQRQTRFTLGTDTPLAGEESVLGSGLRLSEEQSSYSSGQRWLIFHTIVANSVFVTFDRSLSRIDSLRGPNQLLARDATGMKGALNRHALVIRRELERHSFLRRRWCSSRAGFLCVSAVIDRLSTREQPKTSCASTANDFSLILCDRHRIEKLSPGDCGNRTRRRAHAGVCWTVRNIRPGLSWAMPAEV
jgi:hypothetical protein